MPPVLSSHSHVIHESNSCAQYLLERVSSVYVLHDCESQSVMKEEGFGVLLDQKRSRLLPGPFFC